MRTNQRRREALMHRNTVSIGMLAWTGVLLAGICGAASSSAEDTATARAIEKHFGAGSRAPARGAGDPAASPDAMVAFFTRAGPADVTVAARRHLDLDIKFDFDSADLTSEGSLQLDVAGRALNDPQLRSHTFMLAGHTDDRGDPDYNKVLSLRRAQSARAYLMQEHNVDGDRLQTAGFGAAHPRARDQSDAARRTNRRVVLEMVE